MTDDQYQYIHVYWAFEVRDLQCNSNISNDTINQLIVIFKIRATCDCY